MPLSGLQESYVTIALRTNTGEILGRNAKEVLWKIPNILLEECKYGAIHGGIARDVWRAFTKKSWNENFGLGLLRITGGIHNIFFRFFLEIFVKKFSKS